jgi:hypothetical protein
MSGRVVEASQQPTYTPNKTLISFLPTELRGGIRRVDRRSNGVNRNPRAIGCGRRRPVSFFSSEALNEISHETGLIHVYVHRGRGDVPREVYAEEPLNDSHKVNLTPFPKKLAEKFLNSRVSRKINEVIDIHPKRKW